VLVWVLERQATDPPLVAGTFPQVCEPNRVEAPLVLPSEPGVQLLPLVPSVMDLQDPTGVGGAFYDLDGGRK
jgi:hypothetical protein